jgi:hypothetical protein
MEVFLTANCKQEDIMTISGDVASYPSPYDSLWGRGFLSLTKRGIGSMTLITIGFILHMIISGKKIYSTTTYALNPSIATDIWKWFLLSGASAT